MEATPASPRWLWAAEGDAQTANNDLTCKAAASSLVGKNGLWTAVRQDAPYPPRVSSSLDAARVGALHLLSSVWRTPPRGKGPATPRLAPAPPCPSAASRSSVIPQTQ